MWLFRRFPKGTLHNGTPTPEVAKLKTKMHVSADKADQDINKLNKLLEKRDVTLMIYAATRRNHHAR